MRGHGRNIEVSESRALAIGAPNEPILLPNREVLNESVVRQSRSWTAAREHVDRLLTGDAPLLWSVVLSALLGAMAALHVFGAEYVAGTSEFWTYPVGDAAMMVTGWNHLIHDSWRWPLLRTTLSRGPVGVNVLYFDSIPLASLLSKVGYSFSGAAWNPFGAWHLIQYILQSVFGVLVGRRLGVRSWVGMTGLSLLAMSMSVFVLRYYHEGLNGQFVLLWSMLLYLRASSRRSVLRTAAESTACLLVAALQHPYLFVMALPGVVAASVRAVRCDWRRGVAAAVLTATATAAMLSTCGYASSKLPPDPGGFGLASMNLMSLAVPLQSSILPRLPDASAQDATTVQLDGQNFLGLGLWSLLLLALVADAKNLVRRVWRHRLFASLLVPLALYAPSNRWYFGQRLLLEYDIPRRLQQLAATFRATGRFFWPVAYALLILAVVVVTRRYPRRGAAIVLVTGILQVVDGEARVRVVREYVAQPWRRQLDWSSWENSLARVDAVDTYPSYQCWDLWPYPIGLGDLLLQEQEIEFMAARAGKRSNGGRAGRLLTDCNAESADGRALLATRSAPAGHLVVLMKLRFETAELDGLRAELDCEDTKDTLRCRRR